MKATAAQKRAILKKIRAHVIARRTKRIAKLPAPAQPDEIRVAYYVAIRQLVVRPAQAQFQRVAGQVIRLLAELREEQAAERGDDVAFRLDAGGRSKKKRALELVDEAGRRAADSFRPETVAKVAKKFGRETSAHARRELNKQTKEAIGVSFDAIEKPTRDRVPGWVRENVSLIKTVPKRYFKRLERDVQRAFESGMRPETLAAKLVDDYGASESDARRIARDQIGKLNAQVNYDRTAALGITRGIWRGMNDGAERPSHVDLEGEEYDVDDPPTDEQTGEQVRPGEAIECRCFEEPVFDELVADLEASEDE